MAFGLPTQGEELVQVDEKQYVVEVEVTELQYNGDTLE
jgi:hypothetical protein